MTTAPSASDAGVSFDHQPIDVDRFDDVRGCFDAPERLLSTLQFGADGFAVFVVAVGEREVTRG